MRLKTNKQTEKLSDILRNVHKHIHDFNTFAAAENKKELYKCFIFVVWKFVCQYIIIKYMPYYRSKSVMSQFP